MSLENIKVIAFDADDTLWVNEPYYQDCEKAFCELLKDHLPPEEVSAELFKTEMRNLELYGFGAKAYILSMIETALNISDKSIVDEVIKEIISFGKGLIEKPIELLDDIEPVLSKLKQSYKLILATKGDLLDQQRKLKKSGLNQMFDHIEIMSDKKEPDYIDLLRRLNVNPAAFLMVGNSIKSDIMPVLCVGGFAVYVPYHTTWEHEKFDIEIKHAHYFEISKIAEILNILPPIENTLNK